jgi:hypothetical protein
MSAGSRLGRPGPQLPQLRKRDGQSRPIGLRAKTEQSARLRRAVMPPSLDGSTLAALVSPDGDLDGALHAGGGRAGAAVIMAADVKLE